LTGSRRKRRSGKPDSPRVSVILFVHLDITPRRFPVFYRKVIVEMIECFVLTMFVMEFEGEFSP
jgi:hypothetical protein